MAKWPKGQMAKCTSCQLHILPNKKKMKKLSNWKMAKGTNYQMKNGQIGKWTNSEMDKFLTRHISKVNRHVIKKT